MIIVSLIILFILAFITLALASDEFAMIVSGLIIIEFIAAIILCIGVSELRVIDEKIEMYTEENTKIESQMDDLIRNYMEYEGNTFKEFKSESAVVLINLYPELKSDVLVQKQLDIYVANNEKIKELKNEKITGKVKKWWLYFGGGK